MLICESYIPWYGHLNLEVIMGKDELSIRIRPILPKSSRYGEIRGESLLVKRYLLSSLNIT